MILQELLKINEADESQVDLKTFKGKSIPHSAWTDGVTYNGMNVYKTIYDGGRAEKQIDGEMDDLAYRSSGKLDFQESYLGYSPSEDIFIQGYDGDYAAGYSDGDAEYVNCSPYIIFKLNDKGSIRVQDIGQDFGSEDIWYGKNGGHKAAKRKYPDLIDIRLD